MRTSDPAVDVSALDDPAGDPAAGDLASGQADAFLTSEPAWDLAKKDGKGGGSIGGTAAGLTGAVEAAGAVGARNGAGVGLDDATGIGNGAISAPSRQARPSKTVPQEPQRTRPLRTRN
ncbi:MAG: hypothetical protein ACTHJ1_11675 [Bordetella sp.]|uniref:hypothetical protein n=1 Tax=Bordetella sp. TaxID=28081 RepID=UPI003F7C1308